MKVSTLNSGRTQANSTTAAIKKYSKSFFLGMLFLCMTSISVFAGSGIYQTYIIIDRGTGNQYFAGGINSDGGTAFNGFSLGAFCPGATFKLNGGEIKTYKNGISNVTGANLYYRVYLVSGSAPGFTQVSLPFTCEYLNNPIPCSGTNGPGDQKWSLTAHNVNLLSGLTAGNYYLEVYWDSPNSDGGAFDSNFGNNFKATFTVSPPALSAVVTNTSCFGGNNGAINLSVACTPTAAPITQTYTQNFNTLANSGTSSILPSSSPNWQWFLFETGSNANSTYSAGTGSGTAGDTYSYGSATAPTDRAFGEMLSGSLTPFIGAYFRNSTGATVTSISINYIGEQWRLGALGRVDQIDFQYSTDAVSLSTGTWIDANFLDFVAPITTGTVGSLDGNLSANRTSKSGTIAVLSIPNGTSVWIRWTDFNATGSDDGLGVDDFSITLSAPATGVAYLWSPGGATTEDISGLTPGEYTVTVSGSSGTSTATYTVTQPDEIVATETHTAILCKGGNSTVTISATGGTGTLSGTGNFTQLAGTQSYTITDANGCTKSISVTVSEPALLVPTETHTPIACNGGTSTVTIAASGGTPGYTGTGTFTQSAGTQEYFVTDANGCIKSILVTVTQPSTLFVSEIHTNVLCFGGSTGTATISATGGTAPYSGTGIVSGLSAGTHTFSVSDYNGCSASITVMVGEPPAINLTEIHTNVNCNGGDNGAIDLSVSGGTEFETITVSENFDGLNSSGSPAWSNGVTISNWFASVNGSTPSSYIVGTGSSNSGGLYSFGIAGTNPLSERALGSVASNSTSNILGALRITNTTSQTLTSITVNYTGEQWRDGGNTITQKLVFDYQINAASINSGIWNANSALDFTSLKNTATASALDGNLPANRSLITASFPVNIPAGQTIWLRWTDVNDGGNDHGLAIDDLSAILSSGAATPYLYNWSNAATTQDIAALNANTYSVTVTDGNGCTANKSVTISQPSLLVATATITQALCHGDPASVVVTATGGTGVYTGTGTFSLADGASATYSVSDANSCSATSNSVTAGSPSQVVATATITQALCHGDPASVVVTATGGSGAYTGTGTFSLADGASTTFTVSDANGCSAISNSVTAGSPSQLAASSSSTPILCNGGTSTITVSATGGTGAYTGTGTFTVTVGTYNYTVTDANGCSETTSITVEEPTALAASSSSTAILCNGGSSTVTVSATGGTGAYTGTGTFTVTAGTYSYTVTDANGCTAITSITVGEPTLLTASLASQVNVLCFGGATGSVVITPSGGTSPYNITPAQTGLTAGVKTFTVTDANNCSTTVNATITQPATALAVTCSRSKDWLYYGLAGDQTAAITAVASGGTAPYKIEIAMSRPLICSFNGGSEVWSTVAANTFSNSYATCATSAGMNPVSVSNATIISGGSYSVNVTLMAFASFTVTVTDANGCVSTCTINMNAEDVRCFNGAGKAKVKICHKTGNGCKEICVDDNAVAAHLAHGDFLGTCTSNCEAPPTLFVADEPELYVEPVADADMPFNVVVLGNPSTSNFKLVVQSESKEPVQIKLFDVLGNVVANLSKQNRNTLITFGDQLRGGTFFAEVMQGKNRKVVKLIKLN